MKKVIFTFLVTCISCFLFAQVAPFELQDDAPDFIVLNDDLEEESISEMDKDGPIILTFYRGKWCAYCDQYISELAENVERFAELGANVFAISPEKEQFVNLMKAETALKLNIVSDNKNELMKLYNVAYQVKKRQLEKYKVSGINIEENNGKGNTTLPVPATYVIDRNMKIRFVQFDEDYTYRANLNEIYNLLNSLKSERMMESNIKKIAIKREKEQKANTKGKGKVKGNTVPRKKRN